MVKLKITFFYWVFNLQLFLLFNKISWSKNMVRNVRPEETTSTYFYLVWETVQNSQILIFIILKSVAMYFTNKICRWLNNKFNLPFHSISRLTLFLNLTHLHSCLQGFVKTSLHVATPQSVNIMGCRFLRRVRDVCFLQECSRKLNVNRRINLNIALFFVLAKS